MRPSFIHRSETTDYTTPPKPSKARGAKEEPGSVPPPRPRAAKKAAKKATKKAPEPVEDPEENQDQGPGFIDSLIKTTLILSLLTFGFITYIQRDDWGLTSIFKTISPEKPKPNPEKYFALTEELKSQRQQLKQQFLSASTRAEQQEILANASHLLEETLPQMMRCWLGHPYDFNGTATTPGEGKIACGYFVSVVMRDAGFDINRVRVGQQPSQNIIKTFVDTKQNYEVKVDTPYDVYADGIISKYEGIQIVGLDTHVAFVVIKDGDLRYIHASGGSAQSVVDESRENASSLIHSRYRVISNISRNPNVLKRWLLEDTFPTGGIHANIQ